MKKIITSFCIIVASLSSCVKDNCKELTTTAPDSEVIAVEAYLTSKNITNAIKDTRGFYFTINTAGEVNRPSICANVVVNYAGKLITGVEFDSGNGISFPLKNLIIGWQEGIPLIGRGGKITLYLPPSLAYGSIGSGSSVPPNSVLIFTIDLLDFS
jgi:FKBP-type peptidyl-prolyl cis-trans isomerase FkpA